MTVPLGSSLQLRYASSWSTLQSLEVRFCLATWDAARKFFSSESIRVIYPGLFPPRPFSPLLSAGTGISDDHIFRMGLQILTPKLQFVRPLRSAWTPLGFNVVPACSVPSNAPVSLLDSQKYHRMRSSYHRKFTMEGLEAGACW